MSYENPHIKGKTIEELVDYLLAPAALPGSVVHEGILAAIQAGIAREQIAVARAQRAAAADALLWAKISAVSTAVASLIALAALLVAAL